MSLTLSLEAVRRIATIFSRRSFSRSSVRHIGARGRIECSFCFKIIDPPLQDPSSRDLTSWASQVVGTTALRSCLPDQSFSVAFHYGRIQKRCYAVCGRQEHIAGGSDVSSFPCCGYGCDCGNHDVSDWSWCCENGLVLGCGYGCD